MDWKASWTDLWQAEPHRITFLFQAVLPSPANLFTWGKVGPYQKLLVWPGTQTNCRSHQQGDK